MSNFSFLNTYVFEQYSEKDIEKHQKHYLYKLTKEEIYKIDYYFPIPEELKLFYLEIGYGFFHKHHDYSFNRLMDPGSLKQINLREDFYEFDPELDSYEERYQGEKILFFEVNEGIYLAIDKKDVGNKNAIYLFDKKIADSLEDFLIRFDNDPDLINKIEV